MQLYQLRTFLEVARQRNLSRAAELLHLSQPAVSRQLKTLGDSLNAKLFEMIGKKVCLTQAGETLASEAVEILARVDQACERLRALNNVVRGTLRIGASTTPGFYLVPEVLGEFRQRFPGIELQFCIENTLLIEQMIVANELDFAIVGGHISRAELHQQPLLTDRLVVVASANAALAGKRLRPGDLCTAPLILREEGSATRAVFERWLHEQGLRITPMLEMKCPEAIKALVKANLGITVISMFAIREELDHGRLCTVPVSGMNLRRSILLIYHRNKHFPPAAEAFLDLMQAHFRSLAQLRPEAEVTPGE